MDTTTAQPRERRLQDTLANYEARIAWLEAELARVAGKVDQTVTMGDARDTPTPKP